MNILRRLWPSFRAWCRANREAHEKGPGGACCSAPMNVYAAQKRHGKDD